jgi:alpha-D-xyloside xylohydrolase
MTTTSQFDHNCLPDGLLIQTSAGRIKLTPYSERIVRVRYTRRPEFSRKKSLIVETPAPEMEYSVSEAEDHLHFCTAEISILVNKETAALTYQDKTGRLLTKEPDCGGKTLVDTEVVRPVFDESTQIRASVGPDGLHARAEGYRETIDRHAYEAKLEFQWAEGEALYGLGSHEEGMFNLRGQRQLLYQHNMKVVVPVLVSTRGYGILFDSGALMRFHDDREGSFLWSEVVTELDYYFVLGPEFDQIVRGIRQLTGRAPLLPKWAYGYWQSKERYRTQDELIAIVDEYRQRGLPLDCIVLDWHSWPNGLWGQKSLDPERFPDPTSMVADLHKRNARLMVSVWPNMASGGDNWKEMKTCGYLLGDHSTYDAFRPEARRLYWEQAERGLFSHGIDAWWCDCTEPFQADWQGAKAPWPSERMRICTEEAKKYLDPEFVNLYSLVHSQGIYSGQRSATSEKRVVNLTRSGYAGQHRYGTITWSGDITATWDTYRKQIPSGLSFCVTGSPYWTLDIGAYFVKGRPDLWFWKGDYDAGMDDLGFRELYVRWFQYGTFLPIFRSHGTDIDREVWRFGEPGGLFYEALVKFLRLRYRMLPYIYSLAGMVTHQGYTLLRALPFDFRDDPQTYEVEDQFMFGPALMACPVTEPMYYAAGSEPLANAEKARRVYLPAGSDWYDFWTGELYAGGQTITAPAPLDTMPLYVRAGSILPMGPNIQYVDDKPNAPLELRVYPGEDAFFQLYEDEGDNYNYEQGAFTQIPLWWQDKQRRLVIEGRRGTYPGMREHQEFIVKIVPGNTQHPTRELVEAPVKIAYDGKRTILALSSEKRLPNSGRSS